MRFRFSLRWLLVTFTVLSLVFYVLFIRPTVIANRFASAIQLGEVSGMQSFFPSNQIVEFNDLIYQKAEVQDQTWDDVRNFRRRVVVIHLDEEGGPDANPIKVDFEAGLFRVRYIQSRHFTWMNPNPSN